MKIASIPSLLLLAAGLSPVACTPSSPGTTTFGNSGGSGIGGGSEGDDDDDDDNVSGSPGDDDDDDGDDDDDDTSPGDSGVATGPGVRLDVGPPGGLPVNPCGEGGGGGGLSEVAFSNIWIANSPEGTVSKIDTVTGVEIGRYQTGPAGTSDPSRTSVNLVGDVAVLNRGNSHVVKIIADTERCNGATSSGPTDVLPWGMDGCVAWEHEIFPGVDCAQGAGDCYGARALAWDSGNDPESDDECEAATPSLWVSATDWPAKRVHIQRLDGETGEVLAETTIENWDGDQQWRGLYGGAVDQERNFWAIKKSQISGQARLYRVDFLTMEVRSWNAPAEAGNFYGVAMDKEGNPYITSEFNGGLYRFNAATETYELLTETGAATMYGVAVDAEGDAWMAFKGGPCGLGHFSLATGLVEVIDIPECNNPVGVSIDINGFIWIVDTFGRLQAPQGEPQPTSNGVAHKVDPATGATVSSTSNLVQPYTYSDMTGGGLNLVSFPPVG